MQVFSAVQMDKHIRHPNNSLPACKACRRDLSDGSAIARWACARLAALSRGGKRWRRADVAYLVS
eukprot:6179683-Pleurochrysis_carterae.AAC.1